MDYLDSQANIIVKYIMYSVFFENKVENRAWQWII